MSRRDPLIDSLRIADDFLPKLIVHQRKSAIYSAKICENKKQYGLELVVFAILDSTFWTEVTLNNEPLIE